MSAAPVYWRALQVEAEDKGDLDFHTRRLMKEEIFSDGRDKICRLAEAIRLRVCYPESV